MDNITHNDLAEVETSLANAARKAWAQHPGNTDTPNEQTVTIELTPEQADTILYGLTELRIAAMNADAKGNMGARALVLDIESAIAVIGPACDQGEAIREAELGL
jgi:hypothetical protein